MIYLEEEEVKLYLRKQRLGLLEYIVENPLNLVILMKYGPKDYYKSTYRKMQLMRVILNSQKFLKELYQKFANASTIKPFKIRSYIQKRDPDFKEKSTVVLHTYQEANILKIMEKEGKEPEMFIISFNEKSGIQVIDNKYPDLMPIPGKYPYISRDYEYILNGTVCLQAAIDLITGFVHYRNTEKNNSEEFIEFLKMLDYQYPKNVKLKIILDNLRVHTSSSTMQYLNTVPNRFEFVFTPKHASWLNIIESFFSKTTRSVLRGIRVKSKEEIIERISDYIDSINQSPVVFKWSYKMDMNPSGVILI